MARFDIHHAMATLQAKAPDWTATALTEVARTMGRDPFKILIGCLLSLRTKDETTGPAAARLFALAGTPEAMLQLSAEQIAKAIYPVGFYRTKAASILDICRVLVERHGGQVPDTMEALLELKGVGRKTANLVLTMGFQTPAICVDTHVHRISNRWRYVRTKTPEETEFACAASSRRRIGWSTTTCWYRLGRISVSRSHRSVDNVRWLTCVRRSA